LIAISAIFPTFARMQIPPTLIPEIAGLIESGNLVFLHRENLEVVFYPDEDQIPDMEEEDWQTEINKVNADPKKYVKLLNMNSRHRFSLMEEFIETVKDQDVQINLRKAIIGRQPHAAFQSVVDKSPVYKSQWNAFHASKYVDWVKKQMDVIFK
jgi:Uncharacterised protein family (UPF0158)